MSMIKLLALDLDGTLLGPDYKLVPESVEAVRAALDRGVRVMLATGRFYAPTADVARELGLPAGPTIAENGAKVYEYPTGRVLMEHPIPVEDARKVADFCRERGLTLYCYQQGRCYFSHRSEWVEVFKQINRGRVPDWFGDLATVVDGTTTKMVMMTDPERVEGVAAELRELAGDRLHINRGFPFAVEITHALANKGTALAWVAGQLGVDREQVMAVGDSPNDMEMVAWAGTGVAMETGDELLKASADWVAPGGPGIGVVRAIERFIIEG